MQMEAVLKVIFKESCVRVWTEQSSLDRVFVRHVTCHGRLSKSSALRMCLDQEGCLMNHVDCGKSYYADQILSYNIICLRCKFDDSLL